MSRTRAVILETYPCPKGAEAVAFGMISREREIAGILRSLGYEVRGLKPTRSSQPSALGPEDDPWEFVPIDPETAPLPDNRVTSQALEATIANLRPELLLLRGAGTVLGERVADRCPSARTAVLVSGRYRTSSLTTADVVFTETPVQESFLRKRLTRRRLVRLPKFVPGDFFRIAADAPKEYDVAVVGKFEQHKNHRALLPLLRAGHHIVLLGSGSLLERFRVDAAELHGQATYLGEVDHRAVVAALSASRVLVHPSLSEGFPRAVTEAMAAGLPVVGLRSTLSWPLVHGRNALLVDEADLLGAVQRLLEDDELRSALGDEGRRTAAREFSQEALQGAVRAGVQVLTSGPATDPPYRSTIGARARRSGWDATTHAASSVRRAGRAIRRLCTAMR